MKWPKHENTSLYTESYIRSVFSIYGHILDIIMNSKRCRCIIIYERYNNAIKACDMMKIDKKLKIKIIDFT